MEQVTQAFKERWNEIGVLYYGLFQRQRDIVEEVKTLQNKIKREEIEVNISDILSGDIQKENYDLQSKIDVLQVEQSAIEKKILAIDSNGGLTGLYKADRQLKEMIKPLVEQLSAQGKEDEKKRQSLEKRYEKAINEILKLEAEREEFNRAKDKVRDLLAKVTKVTNETFYSTVIRPNYEMKNEHYYRHLGKIRLMSFID